MDGKSERIIIMQLLQCTMGQIGLLSVTLEKNSVPHLHCIYFPTCVHSSWEKSCRHTVQTSSSHLILGLKI